MNGVIAQLIDALKITVSLVVLGVLSFQDYKTREISANLVYGYLGFSIASLVLSLLFTGLRLLEALFIAISLLSTGGLFYLMYRLDLVGDGDFYVALSLGALYPLPSIYTLTLAGSGILPPSLMIILYSSIAGIMVAIANAVYTLSRYRGLLGGIPPRYKLLLPLIGKPVKILDILEGRVKHYTLLESFEYQNGVLKTNYKLLTGVSLDYTSELKGLVEKGALSPESYVWISPGLPYILYLYIGFILVLLLGDKPILTILLRLVA